MLHAPRLAPSWSKLKAPLFAGLLCSGSLSAHAVLWETQADRLQRVSAAMLDAAPVLSPPHKPGLGVRFFLDLSFLPKINPKVGAKSEKVPSSPVHTIPSLEVGTHFKWGGFGLGVRAYGGFLPPLPKLITQIDAKVSQNAYGGLLDTSFGLGGPLEGFVSGGAHWTKAKAEGKIASQEGSDRFDVSTRLTLFGAGVIHRGWGVYGSYLGFLRKSKSKFKIEEGGTDLSLDDDMSDAKIPISSQISVGWVPSNLPYSVSLSFLYVPSRIFMPRLSVSYSFYQADLQSGLASSAESKKKPNKDSESAPAKADAKSGEAGDPKAENKPEAATDAAQPAPGAAAGVKAKPTPASPAKAEPGSGTEAPEATPTDPAGSKLDSGKPSEEGDKVAPAKPKKPKRKQ